MSIIQTIRDKYARFAVIAVAVALTGFILIDYISGRGRSLFNGNSTTLGRINGRTIDEMDFEKKVQIQEQNQQQQNGGNTGEADRQQIITGLWNQQVEQILLQEEYDKLGLGVGKKEFADMLYTDPSQIARQYLGDPKTGQYDPNRVAQIISSIKRSKDQNQKEQLNLLLDAMKEDRLTEKYKSLVAGTIHYPQWILEQQNKDNSLMAKISYVNLPASLISDSAKEAVVTDKEIGDYIAKHKDQFKTEEEARTVEYVLFSAAPSSADSASAKAGLLALKTAFDTAKNVADFIKANSEIPYYDSYLGKKIIQVPNKDSILKSPVGSIYGPYVDKDNYVLAKMIDIKEWPDTVKVRHILISTEQQGQTVREDSTAKKLIDSIQLAIKNGANFDTLCQKYSEDPGSKDKGGVYDNISSGQMVPPFNDFIFSHGAGEKGVVKTEFGYHYIEILSQKGKGPAYKIAYLSKKIEASDETERAAETSSLQFAGESRDMKAFEANFDKELKPKGKQKLFAPDINSHAYDVPGIGVSRKFIKDIFDASVGDVLQPERVGDNYVVAAITQIKKPGTLKPADARTYVEPILRNQKKAALLKSKIGNISTLEAVSASMKQPILTADSIRFSAAGKSPVSYEPMVVGATFNPFNKGKVVNEALEGRYGGVYVIRVDDITATAVENADIKAQKQNLESQGRMRILMNNQFSQYGGYGQQYDPAAVLKKAATIRDYRNKFY